jgi:hypothetical protein
MAAPWDRIFSTYDRNDLAFLTSFMKKLYRSVHEARDQSEDLSYFASLVSVVAATFRENGIDLASLAAQTESSSPAGVDTFTLAVRWLDEMIEKLMESIGRAADNDPKIEDSLAMMQALFLWKTYLLAISVPPGGWADSEVSALSVLWILTNVESADIVKRVRNNGFASFRFGADVCAAVEKADWPPGRFLALYSENRDLLDEKARAILGGA